MSMSRYALRTILEGKNKVTRRKLDQLRGLSRKQNKIFCVSEKPQITEWHKYQLYQLIYQSRVLFLKGNIYMPSIYQSSFLLG